MVWSQIYDPLHSAWLSTLIAALPVIVLLGALGIFRMQAHVAALLGLAVALLAAVFVFRMPAEMAEKPPCLVPPSDYCRLGGLFSTSSFSIG